MHKHTAILVTFSSHTRFSMWLPRSLWRLIALAVFLQAECHS